MSSTLPISPFPANIETADIPIVDYSKLVHGDQDQARLVLEAARGYGFFYLDNHNVDEAFMFGLADRVFELPYEEKMKYDMGYTGNYFGYKASGGSYVDSKGTRDCSEWYNISKDDILRVGDSPPLSHPQPVHASREQLETFMRACHGVVITMLQVLGGQLGLPRELLPSLHRLDRTGGDQVRVTHAPPVSSGVITLGEHTDFGSVTVLFNRVGGLQVLSPHSREFQYVEPRPGAAIINLGDAIVKFVGGRLYSGVHRVVGPPGEQARCRRHSVVYFARPNGNVKLRSLVVEDHEEGEEETITADEWIARRARLSATANYKDESSFFASMGTEHNKEAFKPAPNKPANKVEAM